MSIPFDLFLVFFVILYGTVLLAQLCAKEKVLVCVRVWDAAVSER